MIERGHEVTFFGTFDQQESVANAGINFVPILKTQFPQGVPTPITNAINADKVNMVEIFKSLRSVVSMAIDEMEIELPKYQYDCVLIEAFFLPISTLIEKLNKKYIIITPSIPLLPEKNVPPVMVNWKYNPNNILSNIRIQLIGNNILKIFAFIFAGLIRKYEKLWNLDKSKYLFENRKALLNIVTIPKEFDYPRENPNQFYYAGSFIKPVNIDTKKFDFPFEKLDSDQKLVYFSLGTTPVNNNLDLLQKVILGFLESEGSEKMQMVVSVGKILSNQNLETLQQISTKVVIVRSCPQMAILSKATLFITHGGLNSIIEGLSSGVPMIVIPLNGDQFGNAGRIEYFELGKTLSFKNLLPKQIGLSIDEISKNPKYLTNANNFKEILSNNYSFDKTISEIELKLK